MKKIAISTWCTDDYAQILSVDRLTRSIHYFHPEIDHFIIDTAHTIGIKQKFPWLDYIWMMAPTCLPFADDYDMVIHIDADSVVVGPLDELFNSNEDVIGVRNNNTLGRAGANAGITIMDIASRPIPIEGFLNAGLVGINRKEFLEDWHSLNYTVHNNRPPSLSDENDTLNQLFYSSKFSRKIIDVAGSGVSYGISNLWGNNTHWDSWQELRVKDNGLWIQEPGIESLTQVKVLHQAGGSLASQINHSMGFYPWLYSAVSSEAKDYIEVVTK